MKILIVSPIDPATIDQLRASHDVLCKFDVKAASLPALLSDREVLIFRSGVDITSEVMASAPDLQLIIRAGSGFDNIDLDYAEQNGIRFIRIPGPGARAVAEMSFALMLALARNLLEADRQWRQGRWVKHELPGHSLRGKTLGIVGAGNIGLSTAKLGVAWGMQVMGCVEHPSPEREVQLHQEGIQLSGLEEMLSKADFVSLHVPLKDSTRNMIDAKALSLMKPSAFLVNLARGGVVDEDALYEALSEGRLRGAALDVHKREGEGKISPLAALRNIILTPHIGASTVDTQREIGEIILEHIDQFSAGKKA